MTNQEAFDTVVRHLFAQGRQSINSNNMCAYRGLEGRKCSVGALIPDELYSPQMEGLPYPALHSRYPIVAAYFGDVPIDLLKMLQNAHDSNRQYEDRSRSFDRRKLAESLLDLAREYNLNMENIPHD